MRFTWSPARTSGAVADDGDTDLRLVSGPAPGARTSGSRHSGRTNSKLSLQHLSDSVAQVWRP